MINKKTISPVVATVLLLVVTIISIVGFSDWFDSFQTNIQSDIEINSKSDINNLNIDTIIGNRLFLKNNGQETFINQISINGIICNKNLKISGLNFVDISICLKRVESGKQTLLIQTPKEIIKENIFIKDEKFKDKSRETITKSIDDLVGYWNFEENNFLDKSNYKWSNEKEYKINITKEENDLKNVLRINQTSYLKPNQSIKKLLNGSQTVSFWFKINKFDTKHITMFGGLSFSASINVGHAIGIYNVTKNIYSDIYSGDPYGNHRSYLKHQNIEQGKWYFVASSYDTKKNEHIFYLNGNKTVRTPNFITKKIESGVDLKIGRTEYGFNGFLDEVAIYNRSLTDNEIKELYEGNFIENIK